MNKKIQMILIQLVLELKKKGWRVQDDWRITLQSEQHVPLIKAVEVKTDKSQTMWNDKIETTIDVRLDSDDQITFFPKFNLSAMIFIEGASTKDVRYEGEVDVAFTEKDVKDKGKAAMAANRINTTIQGQMESEYLDYLHSNAAIILQYRQANPKLT